MEGKRIIFVCIHEEEKNYIFVHHDRLGLEGGGGLKALTDMSAKKVSFF